MMTILDFAPNDRQDDPRVVDSNNEIGATGMIGDRDVVLNEV
jgi:hypothetical protein